MTSPFVLCLFCTLLLGSGSVLHADPVAPVYFVTFTDAITGPNQFTGTDTKTYWYITPGADSYQNDFYERPTMETYSLQVDAGTGTTRYAAAEYWSNLDITQARAGFDDNYLYLSIEMQGLHQHKNDGTIDYKGLVERYGFRIANDPDGAGGYLIYSDQPELKNIPNTDWFSTGTRGYQDVNSDVGGTGLTVTREDLESEVDGNGYELEAINDGKLQSTGGTILWVRVDPTNNRTVEFALDYEALGFTKANLSALAYLEFEAIKGGPKGPSNYLWNDEYIKSQAGSPYSGVGGSSEFGTQGLGNIYELDTLRGGAVVPEPHFYGVLAAGMVGLWVMYRRRRRQQS